MAYILLDVTEEELSLQYDVLLESLQGGVVVSEAEPPFHFRYATGGLAQMTGYTIEELGCLKQMDIVHPDDVDTLTADVLAQFANGDVFEAEYRLLRKDGTFIYVLDRGKIVTQTNGKRYIHCLMTDITYMKQMEQELLIGREKNRIALQHSGTVLLDVSPSTEKLSFSPNYASVFSTTPMEDTTITELLNSTWLYPEDLDTVTTLFQDFSSQRTAQYGEFRICPNGVPTWCALHLLPIGTEDVWTYSAIGSLINIHEHRKHIEFLTAQAQKDPLTGCLNRSTLESQVNDYLLNAKNTTPCGILLLDIDDFKSLNDSKGHAFGDYILIELAKYITGLLPQNIHLSRLGGDEFIVFLPDTDIYSLANLATSILRTKEQHFGDLSVTPPITVSIGGSLGIPGACTFEQLYMNADIVMYEAKALGKNQYVIR